jgi:hypothetical protein
LAKATHRLDLPTPPFLFEKVIIIFTQILMSKGKEIRSGRKMERKERSDI